jgi:hypothetical protein
VAAGCPLKDGIAGDPGLTCIHGSPGGMEHGRSGEIP